MSFETAGFVPTPKSPKQEKEVDNSIEKTSPAQELIDLIRYKLSEWEAERKLSAAESHVESLANLPKQFVEDIDSERGDFGSEEDYFEDEGEKQQKRIYKIMSLIGESDELREKIRRENVQSYLKLRQARKYSDSEEDATKLRDMLSRQNKIRELLNESEIVNAKEALITELEAYIEEIKNEPDSVEATRIEDIDLDITPGGKERLKNMLQSVAQESSQDERDHQVKEVERIIRQIRRIK